MTNFMGGLVQCCTEPPRFRWRGKFARGESKKHIESTRCKIKIANQTCFPGFKYDTTFDYLIWFGRLRNPIGSNYVHWGVNIHQVVFCPPPNSLLLIEWNASMAIIRSQVTYTRYSRYFPRFISAITRNPSTVRWIPPTAVGNSGSVIRGSLTRTRRILWPRALNWRLPTPTRRIWRSDYTTCRYFVNWYGAKTLQFDLIA